MRAGELFHHVELWVADLAAAEKEWAPVMAALGCQPFQRWDHGCSWRLGGSYVVIEQSPDLVTEPPYDRRRAGLNHLAVWGSQAAVDAAIAAGWMQRVATVAAVHVVNSEGFELEIRLD